MPLGLFFFSLSLLNSNREKQGLILPTRAGATVQKRYLNVTFYNRPTDRGRNNKTLARERARRCLLSLLISLRKHRRVGEEARMRGGIFSFHATIC